MVRPTPSIPQTGQIIITLDTVASPKSTTKTTMTTTEVANQDQGSSPIVQDSAHLPNQPIEMAELQPPTREEAETSIRNSRPSRSSSVSDLKSDTGTAVQQPIAPPEGSSRTGSLTARGDKERNGSVASSRKSKPRRQETSTSAQALPVPKTAEKPDSSPIASRTSAELKKKSGLSRLISSLVCCGAPKSANSLDPDGQTSPTRKSSKLQPNPIRQTTPTQKATLDAPQSSEVSKGMTEEKIGGPPYSDIKAAQQPRIQERPKEESSTQEPQPTVNREDVKAVSPAAPDVDNATIPTEPTPVSLEPAITSPLMRSDELSTGSTTPTNPALFPASSVVGLLTQVGQDNDVKMANTSDDTPATQEPNVDDSTRHASQTQMAQPTTQEAQAPAAPSENRDSVTSTAPVNEKQTWLLPPIRPEFNGKKCLVLDLDETLVHSSFKVSSGADVEGNPPNTPNRYFIKLILRYPWKLRVSITISTLSSDQASINS